MALPWEATALGAVLLGSWVFAALRGGRRERLGASVLASSWLVVAAIELLAPRGMLLPLRAGTDAVLFVVLARLSWKSERSWPAWSALMQGVALAAHLAFAMRRGLDIRLDLSAVALVRCAQAVALGVGVLRCGAARPGDRPLAVAK